MFFESLDTQAQWLKVERLSKTCVEQITLNETTSEVEGYAQRTSGTTSRPCSQKQLNEWQCLLDAPRRTSNTRSHFTAAETGRRSLPTPMALGSRSDSTTKGPIIVEHMQTEPTSGLQFHPEVWQAAADAESEKTLQDAAAASASRKMAVECLPGKTRAHPRRRPPQTSIRIPAHT